MRKIIALVLPVLLAISLARCTIYRVVDERPRTVSRPAQDSTRYERSEREVEAAPASDRTVVYHDYVYTPVYWDVSYDYCYPRYYSRCSSYYGWPRYHCGPSFSFGYSRCR